MKTKKLLITACLMSVSFFQNVIHANTIDFESLADSSNVGGTYHATYGVDFQNAIALVSGISLNELDFPPHSGSVVIGDNVATDGPPMSIFFANSASSISAFFSYAAQLTFSAYDHNNSLIGTFTTTTSSLLGASQQISLSFFDVSRLDIAGATANSFAMDDLSFEASISNTARDSGSTIVLLGSTVFLLSLCTVAKRKKTLSYKK